MDESEEKTKAQESVIDIVGDDTSANEAIYKLVGKTMGEHSMENRVVRTYSCAVETEQVLLEWHSQPVEDKPPVPQTFGSSEKRGSVSNRVVVERVVRNELLGKGQGDNLRLELDNLANEIEFILLQQLVDDVVVYLSSRYHEVGCVWDDGEDNSSLAVEMMVKNEVVGTDWADLRVELDALAEDIEINLLDQLVHEVLVYLTGIEAPLKSSSTDKSPPTRLTTRTISWNDSCAETATPDRLKSSSGVEEKQDWPFIVQTLLSAAGLDGEVVSDTLFVKWQSPESPLDLSLRDEYASLALNEKEPLNEAKRIFQRSNWKFVLDCVNTVLVEITDYVPGSGRNHRDISCSGSYIVVIKGPLPMLVDNVGAWMNDLFSSGMGCVWGDVGGRNHMVGERVVKKEVVGKGWDDNLSVEDNFSKEIEIKLLEERVNVIVVVSSAKRLDELEEKSKAQQESVYETVGDENFTAQLGPEVGHLLSGVTSFIQAGFETEGQECSFAETANEVGKQRFGLCYSRRKKIGHLLRGTTEYPSFTQAGSEIEGLECLLIRSASRGLDCATAGGRKDRGTSEQPLLSY